MKAHQVFVAKQQAVMKDVSRVGGEAGRGEQGEKSWEGGVRRREGRAAGSVLCPGMPQMQALLAAPHTPPLPARPRHLQCPTAVSSRPSSCSVSLHPHPPPLPAAPRLQARGVCVQNPVDGARQARGRMGLRPHATPLPRPAGPPTEIRFAGVCAPGTWPLMGRARLAAAAACMPASHTLVLYC